MLHGQRRKRTAMRYPLHIVDDKQAMKTAKDPMHGLRRPKRHAKSGVQARHSSRKSGLLPSGQRLQATLQTSAKRTPPMHPQLPAHRATCSTNWLHVSV